MTTERYFYTTNHIHRWSSGPTIHIHDEERGYRHIESLERAKELAQQNIVAGHDESRCDTTYGVEYVD